MSSFFDFWLLALGVGRAVFKLGLVGAHGVKVCEVVTLDQGVPRKIYICESFVVADGVKNGKKVLCKQFAVGEVDALQVAILADVLCKFVFALALEALSNERQSVELAFFAEVSEQQI